MEGVCCCIKGCTTGTAKIKTAPPTSPSASRKQIYRSQILTSHQMSHCLFEEITPLGNGYRQGKLSNANGNLRRGFAAQGRGICQGGCHRHKVLFISGPCELAGRRYGRAMWLLKLERPFLSIKAVCETADWKRYPHETDLLFSSLFSLQGWSWLGVTMQM